MSVGQSQGGLPPDTLVEKEAHILQDSQRLIEAWHDASHGAMVQIALAPCSPFSVSTQLMQQSAELARSFKGQGVRLHTHLAENDHDIAYSQERFGKTPAQYVEDLGWVGPDVWHAHCVKLDEEGVYLFAKTGTGVAHCPCSNMRLASGIAPIRSMLNAGVAVGLGVDGSASNDSGNLLNEARQAMLLARVNRALQAPTTQNGQTFFGCDLGPKEMTARDALHLATRGSAQVLGRHDIGYLAPGMCADIALFDLQNIHYAGAAIHDPVASLMFCHSTQAKHVIINGVIKVNHGELVGLDLQHLLHTHNQMAWQLLNPS
jgi:cytosine/adenosine deaminase-related metal-dependent hydrolase